MDRTQAFHFQSNPAGVAFAVVVISYLLLKIRARILNPSNLPVFNDRKWYEFGYGKATHRYISDPEGWIRYGLKHVRKTILMQSQLVYMAGFGSNNLTIGRRSILSLHGVTFSLDPGPIICGHNWRR